MANNDPITADYLRSIVSYDPETGIFRWLVAPPRRRARAGDEAGCFAKPAYRLIGIKGKRYKAHRLAWLYMTGRWPANDIDHKDRNPSNNRWNNLRQATMSQNLANRPMQSNNTSGYKGVTRYKGKWLAQVHSMGKSHHIGKFDTKEEAAQAYADAARQMFGEFAHSDQ